MRRDDKRRDYKQLIAVDGSPEKAALYRAQTRRARSLTTLAAFMLDVIQPIVYLASNRA